MYRIELLEEPVGDTYRQLLSLAFSVWQDVLKLREIDGLMFYYSCEVNDAERRLCS